MIFIVWNTICRRMRITFVLKMSYIRGMYVVCDPQNPEADSPKSKGGSSAVGTNLPRGSAPLGIVWQ